MSEEILGSDTSTPVADDYPDGDSGVDGKVEWVRIDIDENAEDLDRAAGAAFAFHQRRKD